MNIIWIKCSNWHDLLNLCNAYLSCGSSILIKVPGRLSELKISILICSPCFDQGIISDNRIFEQKVLSIEILDLSWWRGDLHSLAIRFILDWEATLLKDSSDSSGSIKARDSCTTCSEFLSEGSLRDELELQEACEVLSFELFVLSNVRGYHSLNLLLVKHESKTPVVDSTVVADNCKFVWFVAHQCVNQVGWDTTKTETSHNEGLSILDVFGSF